MSSKPNMASWRLLSEDASDPGPGHVIIMGSASAGKTSRLCEPVELHGSLTGDFGLPVEFRLTDPKGEIS